MKCPYCDQEHPDGTEFCPTTGKALVEAAMTTPETVEQTSPTFQTEEPYEAEPPTEALDEPTPTQEAPRKNHRLAWVLGGCVGVPAFILLVLVLIVTLDPFNLHVWGRLNGDYDAAAEVMPADTGIYLGINIGNGLLTQINRVITPFMPANEPAAGARFLPAAANPRNAEQASPFEELWQQIEDETGIKIPDDLSPWVGQYAGAGIVEFEASDFGSPMPTGWILAAEARNLGKADAFLETMKANMTEKQDIEFTRQTYQGVTAYVQKLPGDQAGIAFGRSGRMLMVASSFGVLKKALDRPESQALPKEADYTKLVNVRAFDWTASLYINYTSMGTEIGNIFGSSLSPAGPLVNPYTGLDLTGMLLNLSAISQGARLDAYVALDTANQYTAQNAELQSLYSPPEQVVEMLPQDTVAFLANNNFDQVVQAILLSMMGTDSVPNELWDSLDQTLGFSVKDDLLSQLSGQWALYAVPSTHGSLPNLVEVDLAVSLLAQTEQDFSLLPITDGLKRTAIANGIRVDQLEMDGVTFYELSSLGPEDPILAFSAKNGYFALGTDVQSLHLAADAADTLTKTSNYQTARRALPGQQVPFIYVDLENLFANLREGMDASQREDFNNSVSAIAPIRIVASGTRLLRENIAHSSIVIILNSK